ncbi:MAG: hypothetical protein OEZ16_00475 [Chromatiales bacterium]|nr:hypothetical protein [Chromatiales bacterium]
MGLVLVALLILNGCASTVENRSGSSEVQGEAEASAETAQQEGKLSCYSVRSVRLSESLLTLDCRNPKGSANVVVDIDTHGPLGVSAILQMVALKMRYNTLPDESQGLLDTLSEANKLIQLKFDSHAVQVMVLEMKFDEQNSKRLLELNSRMVTLKPDNGSGIDDIDESLN